jgi:hypothetical protein
MTLLILAQIYSTKQPLNHFPPNISSINSTLCLPLKSQILLKSRSVLSVLSTTTRWNMNYYVSYHTGTHTYYRQI